FAEPEFDEGPIAREVADAWRLDHHQLIVDDSELLPRLLEASRYNDEPLVHGNELHLWAISQRAKTRVSVLHSCEGSDELLGGYVRYQPLRHPALVAGSRWVLPKIAGLFELSGRMRKLTRLL